MRIASLVAFIAAVGLFATDGHGGWSAVKISDDGSPYMAIGPGRNDGVVRLYQGHAYWEPWPNGGLQQWHKEYTWVAGSWSNTASLGAGGPVAIGAPRPDLVNRIYAATWVFGGSWGQSLREATWSAGDWTYNDIGGGAENDLIIGGFTGDGTQRVYVCGSGGITQYTATFGGFVSSNLPAPSAAIQSVVADDIRREGRPSLYAALADGSIGECSFRNGAWTNRVIISGAPAPLTGICCGRARPDHLPRLYVSGGDSHLYEVTYDGTNCTAADLGYGGGAGTCVAAGDIRARGQDDVFFGCNDGTLYRYWNTNGTWQSELLFRGSAAPQRLLMGKGRGDGVTRLYIALGDELYECSYVPGAEVDPLPPQFVTLGNGYVEWTGIQTGQVCDLEWSSDLANPNGWMRDWSGLIGMVGTGGTNRAALPRFFRVVRRTE